MIRNLKAMGLALFAVLALGALGAQTASAVENHTFTADSATATTILTGTTEPGTKEVFSVTNLGIECEDITYRAFQAGNKTDHIAVYPIFNDGQCKINDVYFISPHNNGCTYTFDSDTDENVPHFGTGATNANVSLECGHSGSIKITGGGCTIEVGTTHPGDVIVNHNLPGVRYTALANHSGGKAGMTVERTVRTLRAMATGGNCPLLGLTNGPTHSNGIYFGNAIITCYEGNAFNPHLQSAIEGPLVNCGLSTP